MSGLSAGDLDREIVLQTATRSSDPITNQEILSWDVSETISAEWLPSGTSETWKAQQNVGSYINGVYRIYFRDEPLPDVNRIVGHDGRLYDIKPCIEIGRADGWMVPVVAHGEAP